MNFGGTVKLNRNAIIVILVSVTGLYLLYSWGRGSGKPASNEVTASKVSLCELLCASIAVAEAGGKEVKAVRAAAGTLKEKSKGKTKEGVKDVATDGDMRSHHVMFDTLSAAFPNVKVISEEHDETNLSPKLTKLDKNCKALKHVFKNEWVSSDSVTVWIDPLDATKEYTENLLEYVTTMVCVAVNGKPVIGVIHKPFEDETFWGWVGQEVSEDLDSKKNTHEADRETFVISRSHTGDTVEKFIASKFPGARIKTAGGAGYKALEVATRKQGAYVHNTHIKKWDVCAGHAVLMALGGRVTTLKNTEITYGPADSSLITDGLLGTLDSSDFYNKLYS